MGTRCFNCGGSLQRNHNADFSLKSVCCTTPYCKLRGVNVVKLSAEELLKAVTNAN